MQTQRYCVPRAAGGPAVLAVGTAAIRVDVAEAQDGMLIMISTLVRWLEQYVSFRMYSTFVAINKCWSKSQGTRLRRKSRGDWSNPRAQSESHSGQQTPSDHTIPISFQSGACSLLLPILSRAHASRTLSYLFLSYEHVTQ